MRVAVALGALAFAVAACSDSDTGGSGQRDEPSTTASSTTAKAEPLRVLVTNDDGFAAAGIDALVEAVRALPGVEVTVVAPATNQSGTGDQTSTSPPAVTEEETASGYPATAVAGFPADAVNWALANLDVEFDLVLSGINEGQNIGKFVDISGTVGAAKTAARVGIPAVAISQGLAEGVEPDYAAGVQVALDWLDENRASLPEPGGDQEDIVSLNIPTCTTGEVRGVVEVPVADSVDIPPTDCASTLTNPTNDIQAFVNGYATESLVPAA